MEPFIMKLEWLKKNDQWNIQKWNEACDENVAMNQVNQKERLTEN